MKTEKISSGIFKLFVLVIFWEFVVKGFIALTFLHERGDRAFNITFDLRRHFENKRGVFWDTFLLHLSCGFPLTNCCRITPTSCCICCRRYKPDFHIVVSVASVVSVVRKNFIGQIEFILSRTTSCICRFCRIERLYGRFPQSCICRTNFFRTTDTTDTTIWKPGFRELKASTTGTATTTPQINNLIGRVRKVTWACCTCGTHLWTSPCHPLQNNNVKLQCLPFWWQLGIQLHRFNFTAHTPIQL